MKKYFLTTFFSLIIPMVILCMYQMSTALDIFKAHFKEYVSILIYAVIPYFLFSATTNILERKFLKNIEKPIRLFISRFLLFYAAFFISMQIFILIDYIVDTRQYETAYHVSNFIELVLFTFQASWPFSTLILIYVIVCQFIYKGKIVEPILKNAQSRRDEEEITE